MPPHVRLPCLATRGVPLCLWSSEVWGSWFVEGAVAEHGEEHVDPLSGQAEKRLSVGLPAGSAFVVVGAETGSCRGGERGQEHRAFELAVPASWCVFAVDRGPGGLRGRDEAGVGGEWAAVGKLVPSPTVTRSVAAVLTAIPASRSGPWKEGVPPAGR